MNKAELNTSIERLKKLAAVILAFPDDKWDMTNFGKAKKTAKTQCKTACCVLGHAAITPEFNAQGLAWKSKKYAISGTVNWIIRFEDYFEGPAGARFFGLTRNEENTLFFDGWDKTQTQKAQEILKLVAKRERLLKKAKD